MFIIKRETPDQPDVARLLELADARSSSLYPSESRHGLSLAELLTQNVRFYVARLDGQAVGCGGYTVTSDSSAELKRLFVDAGSRQLGIGSKIISIVEHACINERIFLTLLETGIKSYKAIRLYERLGYRKRGPFGKYAPDPLSVFMERSLDAP
jgi:putative acetyltransferase